MASRPRSSSCPYWLEGFVSEGVVMGVDGDPTLVALRWPAPLFDELP